MPLRQDVEHGTGADLWPTVKIGNIVTIFDGKVRVDPDTDYRMAGVKWYAGGVFHRETVLGRNLSARHLTPLRPGALIYNRLFAWKESFAVVTPEHAGLFVSNEFPQFLPDTSRVLPEFLFLFSTTPAITRLVNAASAGSAAVSRNRFKEVEFLGFTLRLPPLPVQQAIVDHWKLTQERVAEAKRNADEHERSVHAEFLAALGLASRSMGEQPRCFAARWSDVEAWSGRAVFLNLNQVDLSRGKFPLVSGRDCLKSVQHGCSVGPSATPTALEVLKISAATRGEYDPTQRKFIADSPQLRRNFNLKEGDVLMCRTNGTLAYVGMSALVPKDELDLIFPDKLIRVRCADMMLPEYLWFILQSPPLRSQIETFARTAVGNYAIGGSDIWDFKFPLPPLDIQRKLVAEITAARKRIASERVAASKLAADTAREVEEMILGHRPVPTK